jgi:hypothetical protein
MAAATSSDNMKGSLTVYKGDHSVSRRHRIPDSEIAEFDFTVSLGFGVLRAIILRNLQQTLDPLLQRTLVLPLRLSVKPSTIAPQHKYILLTEENFQQTVNRLFTNCRTRQHLEPADIRIPFVIYIGEAVAVRQAAAGSSGIRRATAARIRDAHQEIAAAIERNPPVLPEGSRVGDIAMNVWSRTRAREPNPEPIEGVPQTNTFRQAARLDFTRQENEQPASEWAEVPIRFNNRDRVLVDIHLPSLRAVLGLPPFPLFDRGVFHADAPLPVQVGQDLADIDHPLSDPET